MMPALYQRGYVSEQIKEKDGEKMQLYATFYTDASTLQT